MNRKEIIRYTANELIGKGNIEIISKTFTPDYTAHAGDKEYRGHEFIKQFTKQVHDSIPDIRVVGVEFLAEDIDKIVWQRTLKGTHKHNLQGIPASGKKVKWVDMVVSRFHDEKIAEEWVVSELMGELLVIVPSKRN